MNNGAARYKEATLSSPKIQEAARQAQHEANDPILNTREAARYLGLGKSTLDRFRVTGDGPIYLKLGGAVRYRLSDLKAWLDSRVTRSTSERG
jgi:predicted DNA-binding transcriptional regulator AlpA